MKNFMILLAIALVCLASLSQAEPAWCNGNAKNSSGGYLNGWTIKCNNGTYGTSLAFAPYADFAFSYSQHPPAGDYYFTADSTAKKRLYSLNYYYYDGSSYGVEYGDITFVPYLPPD